MSLLDINQELVNVTCSAAKFGPVTRAVPKGTTLKELSELLFPDTFRSYLLAELNDYIGELGKYRDAIEAGDEEALKELFKAGTKSKQKADRKDPVLTMEL